jgi:multidrug efflux pump subunit AcrA (membrane-fusion protein)
MTTSPSNQPIPSTSHTPLHRRFTRPEQGTRSKSDSTPNLEQQVLAIVSATASEEQKMAGLLKLAVGCTGGIGGFFANRADEQWYVSKNREKVGRIPAPEFFDRNFSQKCEGVLKTFQIQTWNSESLDGILVFSVPVQRGDRAELMILLTTAQAPVVQSTRNLTRLSAAMRLWLNANEARAANWEVESLASIIAIVSQIEPCPTLESAAEEAVNLMANQLPVTCAAIGTIDGAAVKLRAVSGVSKLDSGSKTGLSWLQTMVESQHRKQAGLFPAIDDENNFLLQAHRRLAADLQAESVFSQPLVTEDDELVGIVAFAGNTADLSTDAFHRFNATAAPPLAAAIRSARKQQRSRWSRAISWVREKTNTMPGIVTAALMLAFIMLMFLPITYRVRCTVITEPVSRRFAVAPFAGQIIEGYAESGDFVSAGQVLAELDGRTIRWDLFGVSAEREQSVTSRRMELSERNIPKAILAQLETERLQAQQEVLRYKEEHLQVRSPIDGIVLSGSLERSEAASVETGQTLFEIGPVKPMRIEIEIPANEVAQTKPGFPVSIWIDGQEDSAIKGEILKIRPRSTTRNAKNVFIAEVEFPNEDERLRPGMEGTARIDCERRSLGWSMFHKPMNWLRANFSYF